MGTCTLCGVEETDLVDVFVAGTSGARLFCSLCASSVTEPETPTGRWIRRTARGMRRRFVIRNEAKEPWKIERQRELCRQANARYRQSPEGRVKLAARKAVRDAVKKGRLVRPAECSKCGRQPPRNSAGHTEIHFHHTHGYDMANRFVGEWVCRLCHHDLEAAEQRHEETN